MTSPRLGVSAALSGGKWVPGDVAIDDTGRVTVALSPPVGSGLAVPGFVDHQVNGYAGIDFRVADEVGLETAARAMALDGVVAFRPTLHSTDLDTYRRALGVLARVAAGAGKRRDPQVASDPQAATMLESHLEGPFLSPDWRGAHDRAHLIAPSIPVADSLLAAGPVGMITVAPELPGALLLIAHLVRAGVVVSIGHSDADAAQVAAAVNAGATMVTHVFNAHRRFSARDPGIGGAALVNPKLLLGLIADGVHLADDVVRLVFVAGGDRVRLVSDAIAGDRATGSDGIIAGSVTPLQQAVRRCIDLGIDPALVVTAASGGPSAGWSFGVTVLDEHFAVRRAIPARGRRV